MKKSHLIIMIVIAAAFSSLFYFQKKIAPQKIQKIVVNLDVPAKYTFVSDKNSKKLAVVDSFTNSVVDYMELEHIPNNIIISKLFGVMVYTSNDDKNLYTVDLKTRDSKTIDIGFVATEIIFNPDGRTVAAASNNKILLVDIIAKDKKIEIIDGFSGELSLNYNTDGRYLYITEIKTGKVFSLTSQNNKKELLIDVKSNITATTLSPDSRLILVTDTINNNVNILSSIDNSASKKIILDSTPNQPYITNDSKNIIITTTKSIYIIDTNSLEIKTKTSLDKSKIAVKAGWLEKKVIIGSDKSIFIADIDDNPTLKFKNITISGMTNHSVVLSDSKTMLLTQNNSKELIIFDIRNSETKAKIELNLEQPNILAMGITNTICH